MSPWDCRSKHASAKSWETQGRRTTVHFLAILIFNIMLNYFKFGSERISNAFACFMHASFSTTKV